MAEQIYTKPALRQRLKAKIMRESKGGKAGEWSARKSQLLALAYKAAGGGYRGKPAATQKSMQRWTKEEWGTKSGKPSIQGEKATGERYLPKAAIKRLTKGQYAATTAKKRKAIAAGEQFSSNTKAAIAAKD